MKKNIVIVLIVIFIAVIAYVLYMSYGAYKAMYIPSIEGYVVIPDPTKRATVTLSCDSEGAIYKKYIRVRNESDGDIKLTVLMSDGKAYEVIKVRKGKEGGSSSDWYSKDCKIIYEPINVKAGLVSINYAFLGGEKFSSHIEQ